MRGINKGIKITLPFDQSKAIERMFVEWNENSNNMIELIIIPNPDGSTIKRLKFVSNIIFVTFKYGETNIELLVEENSMNEIDLEIQRMGIPLNSKGYKYLREAIVLVLKDSELISAMTKELYPTIAKLYNVSPNSVEKAIRTSINSAWGREYVLANSMVEEDVFYFVNKPKNSELISVIAERVRGNLIVEKKEE